MAANPFDQRPRADIPNLEGSVELVTLAHVTLYRPGSASRHCFGGHQPIAKVVEVRDGKPATLREFVETYAEEHGELRASLKDMQQVQAMHFTPNMPGAIVFNVQGSNTQYSTPYAACLPYPALKVGTRYFKLKEIELG